MTCSVLTWLARVDDIASKARASKSTAPKGYPASGTRRQDAAFTASAIGVSRRASTHPTGALNGRPRIAQGGGRGSAGLVAPCPGLTYVAPSGQ